MINLIKDHLPSHMAYSNFQEYLNIIVYIFFFSRWDEQKVGQDKKIMYLW